MYNGRESPWDLLIVPSGRDLFFSSPVPTLLVEAQGGRIVDANRAALGLYGLELEDLRAKTLDDLGGPGEGHTLSPASAGGALPAVRATQQLAGGAEREVELTFGRLEAEGRVLLLVAVRDLSELVAQERKQRASLAFESALLEAVPCAIFYKDAQGRYLGCNEAFARFLGKPKSEIVGQTVFAIAPPERAATYQAADRELFEHPGVQVYRTEIPHADGTLHSVVLCKATYEDAAGEVAGLIGVLLDLTELEEVRLGLAAR